MFISVDLPEPDEPMMATNSPALDRQADAAQRLDLDIADDEAAGDVLDPDHRRLAGGTSAETWRNIGRGLKVAAAAGRPGRPPERCFRR